MNKRIFALLWIFGLVFSLMGQERTPLITEIGLIENDVGQRTTPPNNLTVGLEVSRNVFYKISEGQNIIKGGQFLRGFNSFRLDVHDRFNHTGTYNYTIELKDGARIFQKQIHIGIRIDLPTWPEEKKTAETTRSEHLISMYIGGRLIVTYRKLYTSDLSEKIAAIPRPYTINPYDSSAEPSPYASGIPIMAAAAAAVKAITELLGKKDTKERVKPVVKKTHISTTFVRNNPSGGDLIVTAVISLWVDTDFF